MIPLAAVPTVWDTTSRPLSFANNVQPQYTQDALAKKIEGTVDLD